MDLQNRTKLNLLLQKWPKGSVFTSHWLEQHGISRQLKRRYEEYSWIKSIGPGAVIRSGDTIDWYGGLYALQQQLNKSVYVGGKTALEMQGLGHFVRFKETDVYLYGPYKKKDLPRWFLNYNWGPSIHYINSAFLPVKLAIEEEKRGDFTLMISSPERAIFEVLKLIPDGQSFEEASLLMENLSRMRPYLIQELLEACSSIKVKRLFLFFAEHLGHAWLAELHLDKVNLGKGKRVIIKNGHWDSKYQITVPKNYKDADG